MIRGLALVLVAALAVQDRGQEPPKTPAPPKLPPIPVPAGDDWTQFGHDAKRTNLTADNLDLPLIPAWSYRLDAGEQLTCVVAAAGYLHLSCTSNGGRGGAKNPVIISLNALTGEYRGMFSPDHDQSRGTWLSVFDDYNVLYHDDALGAFDCRTFADRRWINVGRSGSTAVDPATKTVVTINEYAGDGEPPLTEATAFDGRSRWKNNVWPVKKDKGRTVVHEVNISGTTAVTAVRFTGAGVPPPKDGVYAFDVVKGTKLWLVEGKFRNVCSDAKRTYALDDDGVLHAIDLKDGKEAWTATLGNVAGSPGMTKDRIIALLDNGSLLSINPEDGKIAWRARTQGAGVAKNAKTALVLSAQGHALVCTNTGLAIHDLEKGAKLGEWKEDEGQQRARLQEPLFNPIAAHGLVFVCARDRVVALWTGTHLKEQAANLQKHADLLRKAGKTGDAVRFLRAIEAADGLKEGVKKMAQDELAELEKLAEKEYAEAGRMRGKGLLALAQRMFAAIAREYVGFDVAKKATEDSDALTLKLNDSLVASEALYKEAQWLEDQKKTKEAIALYQEVAGRFPDTMYGRKAADRARQLSDK